MAYPSFSEHLRSRYGRNWCVAARASGRTARYDTVITPKNYNAAHAEWVEAHPAVQLAKSLPDCPEKQIVVEAVRASLA